MWDYHSSNNFLERGKLCVYSYHYTMQFETIFNDLDCHVGTLKHGHAIVSVTFFHVRENSGRKLVTAW